jgi:transglutaminase-like putative cysteine protease
MQSGSGALLMTKAAQLDLSTLVKLQSNISVQRYFEVSLLLTLATGFVTVAMTGKLDMVSIVVVSTALAVKLWSYSREADYSLSPRTVTRISIFYIFFYGLDFLIFSPGPSALARMLTATVHLILFTTVIKIFSARTYRDYSYLATLSFMMMLASAILTVSATYLVFFTLYVIFAISTFISYEIKQGIESASRAPEGPFRKPRQNRAAVEGALMRAAVGLAVGIFLLATVLFFVIPRHRTGYLTSLSAQAQNITGFSDTVNIGDIRKILRSPMVVMRVTVEGDPRQFQGVKWRGVGLTSFDGKHWFNDNTEQIAITPASEQRFVLPQPDGWKNRPRRPVRYHVLRSALSTDVLFAAPTPHEVMGRFHMVDVDETGSLHSPQYAFSPFTYDVVSETGLPSPQALRRAPTTYPDDVRLVYLRLPDLDPNITELARQITSTASNNYDRATAIQNYLRDNLRYTLDPPFIESEDPLGSFLFKSKSGYCEYFAASMAVMLRTLDIPSRLVNGFQTGSYNRIGRDFVVRARDAHSWVEVYFPNYGWITFDPTPADPNPIRAGAWDDYLDALNLFWSEWIVNYDFSHQVRLARQVEQTSRDFQQDFWNRTDRLKRQGVRAAYRVEAWLMSHKLFMLLLMVTILAALVAGEKGGSLAEIRSFWVWKFGRRELALSPRQATMTYQRLLKTLRKKGYRKPPAQTPWEFARSLLGTRLGSAVWEFTRLYNLLRFGQAPVPMARLRQILDEISRLSRD